MSDHDESGRITISPAHDESSSVILGSLVTLAFDVLVYAGIAVHTMLCRRKYGKYIDEMEFNDLSLPIQLFMLTPAPIYAAGFLLTVVALILKECAIDRKEISLKINLFGLAFALCLFITFLWTVQFHFDALLSG